jgi:hypothetical protein
MQHLALSHLLRFCNEDQLKSNKEYGDGLNAVLALVRTDQEKARYTFLEDVQQPGRITRTEWYREKKKIEEQNGIRKQS